MTRKLFPRRADPLAAMSVPLVAALIIGGCNPSGAGRASGGGDSEGGAPAEGGQSGQDTGGAAGGTAVGGAAGDPNPGGGAPGGGAGVPDGVAGSGGVRNGGAAGTPGLGGAVGLPAGRVPMVVAVGRGGRRVMSCDRGRTWSADKFVAPESQDNEHQTYTPKGLTYGNGTFVFLTGWGNPSTTWVSKNGIDWVEQKQPTSYGGVGFDQGDFVLVGNRYLSSSKDNAATWSRLNIPQPAYDRDAAAFAGIWAAASDGQVVTRRTGGNWTPLSGCLGNRHGGIGSAGGFVAGLGVMVSVGEDGRTCGLNIATGTVLASGSMNAAIRGKPSFVGDALWVASGDKIHSSTDGVTWTSRALPMEVRFDLVARDASGTYVGVAGNGDAFFYSDNGQNWTKAKGPPGNGLNNLVAGAGSPSAQCPLP